MQARRREEEHRSATTLELLFDLCFVVAVAQAAAALHHAASEGHPAEGLLGFVLVFFAIWWAWMNFSWFASSYDCDDVPYRVATLVQIAGGLVLAAGVESAVAEQDFAVITYGYVLMRLAMVTQWVRAALSDPERRSTALRYVVGIAVVQAGWLVRLALPDAVFLIAFLVLGIAEVAVPVVAERVRPTSWHREHIAERYGLFTIIVLGESVLSVTVAIQALVSNEGASPAGLLGLGAAGLVILFSMWWIYFDRPASERLTSSAAALRWGYGHYVIFGSGAAVGAGLAVAVDHQQHVAHLGTVPAALMVTVPVALYVVTVWLLHLGPRRSRVVATAFPLSAVLILGASFTPAPVPVTAVLIALLVAALVVDRQPSYGRAGDGETG